MTPSRIPHLLLAAALCLAGCAVQDAGDGADRPVALSGGEVDGDCQPGGTGACCPDPDDPDVEYIAGSFDDPSVCDTIGIWQCDEGWDLFTGDCGCGCARSEAPPDPDPTCECDCPGH